MEAGSLRETGAPQAGCGASQEERAAQGMGSTRK